MPTKSKKRAVTIVAKENQEALRQFKAEIFQVLAHPTRLHLVECLCEGEQPVSTLLERTGIEPTNASQHLALLRARRLVTTRKVGNQVFYALRDPLLKEMLETMRQYFQSHLEESLTLLQLL